MYTAKIIRKICHTSDEIIWKNHVICHNHKKIIYVIIHTKKIILQMRKIWSMILNLSHILNLCYMYTENSQKYAHSLLSSCSFLTNTLTSTSDFQMLQKIVQVTNNLWLSCISIMLFWNHFINSKQHNINENSDTEMIKYCLFCYLPSCTERKMSREAKYRIGKDCITFRYLLGVNIL